MQETAYPRKYFMAVHRIQASPASCELDPVYYTDSNTLICEAKV